MSNTSSNALPQRCEKCGTTATSLAPTPRPFRKRDALFCSKCRGRHARRWLLLYILFVVIGVLLASQISHALANFGNLDESGYSFVWVWAAAWTFGGAAMILVHESAHAAVAIAVGMKVSGLSLGRGPRLLRLHLKKIFVDIHVFPGSGVCWTHSCPTDGWRWRQALTIAAGPATNALALATIVFIWLTHPAYPVDEFTDSTPLALPTPYITLGGALFSYNIVLLAFSLVPNTFHWNGKAIRTDGGQLLDLLTKKDPTTLLAHSINTLGSLGDQGKWEEVHRAARAMLEQPSAKSPHVAASIGAWLAVADVYLGGEENLKEADTLSTHCLASAPNDPALLTVRACVLMALNRNDEAESLLLQAQSGVGGPYAEKAAAHLWTELHRRRNNPEQMHHWQTIAQKLNPTAAYKIFRDPTPLPDPHPI